MLIDLRQIRSADISPPFLGLKIELKKKSSILFKVDRRADMHYSSGGFHAFLIPESMGYQSPKTLIRVHRYILDQRGSCDGH